MPDLFPFLAELSRGSLLGNLCQGNYLGDFSFENHLGSFSYKDYLGACPSTVKEQGQDLTAATARQVF